MEENSCFFGHWKLTILERNSRRELSGLGYCPIDSVHNLCVSSKVLIFVVN